jgi:hypothetical protein
MLLFLDGLLYMPTTVDVTRQSSEIEVIPVPQVSPLNDDNVTSDRDIQTNRVNLTIYVFSSNTQENCVSLYYEGIEFELQNRPEAQAQLLVTFFLNS